MYTFTVYLRNGVRAVIIGSSLENAMAMFRRSMDEIEYSRSGRDDSMVWDAQSHKWTTKPLMEAEVS